jgi:hypothetical protein
MVLPDATRRLTTQLYFPESLNDEVMSQSPYAGRGSRDVTNANDNVVGPSLDELTCEVEATANGYVARYGLGVLTS